MASDVGVKVFYLSFKVRVHIIPNYYSGKPYLKLFRQRQNGKEDTFFLSMDNFAKMKALGTNLDKEMKWDLGEQVHVGAYTHAEHGAKYVCLTRCDSLDPEYPDFHMPKYCWDALLCREISVEDAAKEVAREEKKDQVPLKICQDTSVHVEDNPMRLVFTRTTRDGKKWTHTLGGAAFAALKAQMGKERPAYKRALETESPVNIHLAQNHHLCVSKFNGKMFIGFAKYDANGNRVRGNGINMNPDNFAVLERNMSYLNEAMVLAGGELARKEADMILREKPYIYNPTYLAQGEENKEEEEEEEGEDVAGMGDCIEVNDSSEPLDLRMKRSLEKGEMEEVDMLVSFSSEEGYDTVDMDMEEIGAQMAAASSKTPKRKDHIQAVPGAPKKQKTARRMRPTVPQYKWEYVDQKTHLVSGGGVWYYSLADCHNEAERLKPTYTAMNKVPRDISLKIDRRVVDKPTAGQVLKSVVYKYAVDRIEEMAKRYCEGCARDAPGQMAHMDGCLNEWEKSVEKYGCDALKQAKSLDCHQWCRNLLEFFNYPVDTVPQQVASFVDESPKEQLSCTLKRLPILDAFLELCRFRKPRPDF